MIIVEVVVLNKNRETDGSWIEKGQWLREQFMVGFGYQLL